MTAELEGEEPPAEPIVDLTPPPLPCEGRGTDASPRFGERLGEGSAHREVRPPVFANLPAVTARCWWRRHRRSGLPGPRRCQVHSRWWCAGDTLWPGEPRAGIEETGDDQHHDNHDDSHCRRYLALHFTPPDGAPGIAGSASDLRIQHGIGVTVSLHRPLMGESMSPLAGGHVTVRPDDVLHAVEEALYGRIA